MRKCILFILISLSTVGVTAQNITTFAGNNIRTFFNGASGPNAQLAAPWGLMITRAGNIYIADRDNCAIRMLSTTSGTLTTVVGCGIGGNAGDGGAATASYLKMPFCVVADISGNIYVSDRMNHKIRKVNPAGVITTYAGTGVAGFSGDGGAAVSAQLNEPAGITLDDSGNLYVADLRNNRIRKISLAGTITTIAGTGALGYSGDGGLATAARLSCPNTIGLDNRGNKYIIDSGSHIIRKISARNFQNWNDYSRRGNHFGPADKNG
jgi:streptogramin lyase